MDLWRNMNGKMVGSGKETIILAHGYGGDQSVWDKILPKLCESYKIVLFDWSFSGAVLKGHFDVEKYSSYEAFADDLIALADEMKLESSIFVGHSMSGIIGCIASIKRPTLFKRLILVSSSPRSYLFSYLTNINSLLLPHFNLLFHMFLTYFLR